MQMPPSKTARRPVRTVPALVVATVATAATLAVAAGSGPADVRKGREVLEQSAAAYAAAPALLDLAKLEIRAGGQPAQKVEIQYGFGPKTDAFVKLPGLSATALDGRLFVTRDDVPRKYLDVALQGDLAATMDAILGTESNMPVQFDMRAGRGVDEFLPALSMGVLEEPRIAGHAMDDRADGGRAHTVDIEGSNGSTRVWIDAKTKLVRAIELEARSPAPQPMDLTARMDFSPRTAVSPGGVVSFDPAGRKSVARYDALNPEPVVVGSEAPDFELETLDGETVRLSDHRGQVVVLDFWATWCGPCRMGLPLLEKFHVWARESGKPVAVYAIDTFERADGIDAMRTAASAFWSKQGFTMPSLLDPDNQTAYQYTVSAIPITFVIDPTGRVAKIHQGYDPGMVKTLERDVEALLR